MKKSYLVLLLLATSGFAVFAYNYWSYSCGRCNAQSLTTLSPPAWILIPVNLLAAAGWAAVHVRRRKRRLAQRCRCGAVLQAGWLFCPDCGQARALSGG